LRLRGVIQLSFFIIFPLNGANLINVKPPIYQGKYGLYGIMERMNPAVSGLFVVRLLSSIFAILMVLGTLPETAVAGFGISPPYVINDRLTPGAVFEQEIIIVRSDPLQDLKAEITMNIPGVEAWFTVLQGNSFILPKGKTQVPMVVRVNVPQDAAYEGHKGSIRIRTAPVDNKAPEGGGVTIALGAQIDVNIKVVDKILDFTLRKIRMADLEEGRTKWGLFFPAKIRFLMTVENTGNAPYAPTKVHFDIYDSEVETLLESVDNTNDIPLIKPYAIEEVIAELPTRLPQGRYTAKYTVYKGETVAQQGEVNVSIAAIGAVPGYEGYGIWGLSLVDKLKAIGVLVTPILLLIVLISILASRRKRRKRRRVVEYE
jgi:hypothetical protein